MIYIICTFSIFSINFLVLLVIHPGILCSDNAAFALNIPWLHTCSSSLPVSSSLLSKNSSISASKFCRSPAGSTRPSADKHFKAEAIRSSCLAAIITSFAAKENKSIDLYVIPFHSSKSDFTWSGETLNNYA